MAYRDDPLPVEAVRDLLGVVRAMYAANKGVEHRRRALAAVGHELVEAMNLAKAHAPGTDEHRRAWQLAESALVVVGTQYSRSEGLAPTLPGAIDRVRGRYSSGR